MKLVRLPDQSQHRLPFYLAMEEWIAASLPADDYIFTWIVSPTVIVGRNQDIVKEVNIPYCREHGIDLARRRSGGGCVFADLNNIMVSYVTPSVEVETTFAVFTRRVASQLCKMGLDATATGRNDIMVGDRKISGNAFYHVPGRSIVHGTMLYNTDAEFMANAITPSRAKLAGKGVRSVRSHIVTASQLLPGMSLDTFHERLLDGLYDDVLELTADNIAAIEAIEQNYYRPEWLMGLRHATTRDGLRTGSAERRVDGAGTFDVTVAVDADGILCNAGLTGDFFMLADLDSELLSHIVGVPCRAADLRAALAGTDVSRVVSGLSNEAFAEMLAAAAP